LHYVPHALGDTNGTLEDVITARQVEGAFQSIYSLVRQMKHAGWRLMMSIAGGRKTLSFTALSVAQVLFDHEDSVWHLVSAPELQRSRALHAVRAEQTTLVQMPLRVWQPAEGDSTWRTRTFLERSLTPAEREVVLLLLREGLSNQMLAERLGKSVRTIENQLSRIYAKAERDLGLETRVDRVVLLTIMGGNPYVE
jgi:DNA-binding CsgD family transcriptional regulator